ncbi:hypothetical protein [Actinomadura xylanilytica]|uniref:hypothetical protein n=1 Tax=Actinomadura xylanilytica TaxID=887459 RepID=UPI00255B24F5|nr:hypothetical protein [Actinomadura xylanilytica]MDL4776948.1 hypothetical protein [Actinomadura xylanilytica]
MRHPRAETQPLRRRAPSGFHGQATGETFTGRGKSDILLRWITADDQAKASFAGFVGTAGYDAAGPGTDIDRFGFLLGPNDGEHLLA